MNYQDSLGNWNEIILEPSGDTLPIGAITEFGGANAPTNWLFCDGSAISRTDYAELFSAIGTTYGVGDGNTTFNLPDFRGRVPVGLKSSDSSFDTLGETGGEKTHTLTVNEMPSHGHSLTPNNNLYAYNYGGTSETAVPSAGDVGKSEGRYYQVISADRTGGDGAHNNLQPYIVTNYIIKAKQSIGIVGTVSDDITDTNTDAVPTCATVKGYVDKAILFTQPSAGVTPTTGQYVRMSNLEIIGGKNYSGKLSISNGKIVVGSGISKVKIKRIINVTGTAGNNWTTLYSYAVKNNSNISRSWQYVDYLAERTIVLINEDILDVEQGDVLTVSTYCDLGYQINDNATKVIIEEI